MSPFLLLPGQVGMLEYVDLVTTTIRPQIKAFRTWRDFYNLLLEHERSCQILYDEYYV
jgi:hypothetical protein